MFSDLSSYLLFEKDLVDTKLVHLASDLFYWHPIEDNQLKDTFPIKYLPLKFIP